MAASKRLIKGGSLEDCAKDKCTPIILNRVSTYEQKRGLPVQVAENKKKVKDMGFNKEPVEITAQESGEASYRRTLAQALKVIADNPKKKYVLFVRDVPRFSRERIDGQAALKALNDAGIPVVILDAGNLYLDGALENYASQMVFDFLLAVAASGKSSELLASLAGTEAAAEKGVFAGGLRNFYPELRTKAGTIYRRIWESRGAIKAKTLTNRQLQRDLKMVSPTTVRQIRTYLLDIAEKAGGGAKGITKVEEYLDVADAIVAAEKTRGVGSRLKKPAMTNRARSLHRVTVGYLLDPFNWPRPDTEGNPAAAVKDFETATGTIQDAVDNYTRYFKKAGR